MAKEKIISSLQERHHLDASRAGVVASLVRANQLQLSAFSWDDFSLARDKILALLHTALIKRDPVALLDYLDFTSHKRDELDDLTRTLITILRDVLALRCGTGTDFILHHDISDKLCVFADGLHREDISMFLEKALRLENNFNRNVNKKLAFETLFLSYYRYRRDREAGKR
jgi:DNA polymerase III gamma/tau subunit